MKTRIISSIILLLSVYISGNAQHTAITTSKEISRNLDLKAVAYLFGESNSLNHFEQELNNPNNAISNLDLNRDGYVDYLRVVETNMQHVHTVNIQAVIGNNIYKDVAMIGVQKDNHGKTYVRMIGNNHLYGANYIINPVYNRQPIIVANFWKPNHKPYNVSYHKLHPVYHKARVVCSTPAYNKQVKYQVTGHYNTNHPSSSNHYSTQTQYKTPPHAKDDRYNNTSHQSTNKQANNSRPNYSGKQYQNSQTKVNKPNNNQGRTITATHNSRQNNSTVRFTDNKQNKVDTKSKTPQARMASNSRSSARTSTPRGQTNSKSTTRTSTPRGQTNSKSTTRTSTPRVQSTRSALAMK